MTRERVIRCCEECPFLLQSEAEVFTYCTADGESVVDGEADTRTARQPWCPLDAGAITIKAGEP